MKLDWNTKYTTISTYVFTVACAVILFYLSISELSLFLSKINKVIVVFEPIIIGFFIAYILNFLLIFYDRKIFNKIHIKSKSKRILEIIFTYLTAFFIIYLFSKIILPQLFMSIVKLSDNFPKYINRSIEFSDQMLLKLNIESEYLDLINNYFKDFTNYLLKVFPNSVIVIGKILTNTFYSIWNLILGLIISFYLLIDKEKFCGLTKKIMYGIFPKIIVEKSIKITKRTDNIFGKFLVGKIFNSLIIGILMFIVLIIFRIPYSLLVSFIIGITNMVPFLGPFIGAIPSLLIILLVSPVKALWFLVIIIVVQQIDSNIISPKILGESIGISAFWILFAILVGEKCLGIIGLIVGVPLFAVIYSLVKEVIENRLRRKNLKVDTKDYM
ncbi:AI-2E family transporter [Clostridium sp. CTA-5]